MEFNWVLCTHMCTRLWPQKPKTKWRLRLMVMQWKSDHCWFWNICILIRYWTDIKSFQICYTHQISIFSKAPELCLFFMPFSTFANVRYPFHNENEIKETLSYGWANTTWCILRLQIEETVSSYGGLLWIFWTDKFVLRLVVSVGS